MKITYVYPEGQDHWFNADWRCNIPARAINRSGRHGARLLGNVRFSENSSEAQEICKQSDIIVVYHDLWGRTLSVIQHWRARDKTVIADFDEAYHLLEKNDSRFDFWMEGRLKNSEGQIEKIDPPPIMQFKWGLQNVDAATVPSKRLADDWQAFTPVTLVPNYVDLERYQVLTQEIHDGIILGWSGRSSRLVSFRASGALEALQAVLLARPKVRLMFCTDNSRMVEELGLPTERVIFYNKYAGCDWPRPLVMFDAAVIPLHGAFDQRSSGAELLEYMATRIPWVASQGPAVHDFRPYGWVVENTAAAWEKIILDVVDHLTDYRFEATQAPYFFGIGQSIDENVHHLIDVYAKISNRAPGRILTAPGRQVKKT